MAAIDQSAVRRRVREFIGETFLVGNEKDKLNDSDSFMQHGIVDSTGILELATFIESEYSLTIEDNEMVPDNLDSIDNLAGFVARKLG
jgi:acyl carrier protein